MYLSMQPRVDNSFEDGPPAAQQFESMDTIKAKLRDELEFLGDIYPEPPRNEDEIGLLAFRDFILIYKIIRIYTHPSNHRELHELTAKRRHALKKNDDLLYQ